MEHPDQGHPDHNPESDRHPPQWATAGDPGREHRTGGRHRYEDRVGPAADRWAVQAAWGMESTGAWEQLTEPRDQAGRDSLTDTGQWTRSTDTGQWNRLTDTGEWCPGDLAELDPSAENVGRRPRHLREETFWEGTRLAGDDPRWMPTPASAPQSPAVTVGQVPPNLPAMGQPQPLVPHQRDSDAETGRRSDDGRVRTDGPLAVMWYALTWYAVPLVILFLWLVTLDGRAPAGCVTDANGAGCESPQAAAVASIVAGAPQFGIAVVASLLVALLLYRMTQSWRATSVGLAAALIGGGLTTVVLRFVGG